MTQVLLHGTLHVTVYEVDKLHVEGGGGGGGGGFFSKVMLTCNR